MELSREQLLDMYQKMVRAREFELSLADAAAAGTVPGHVMLGVGQEAVHVGVPAALRPTDWISSTHRDHGMLLARGSDMGRMRAEIFGKGTGYCKGKGGTMHLAVYEKRMPGCNAILGPSQTINNGIALALKRQGKGDIAVVLYGEGASHRGEFHEALNLAGIWKLPVLSICVNNHYAVGVSFDYACSVGHIASRASGYGMPGTVVDGSDVKAVYEAVREAAGPIRKGRGPALIEIKAPRLRGHMEGDLQTYRSKEDLEEAWKNDPIAKLTEQLLDQGIAAPDDLERLRQEVAKEIEAAVEFERKSEYPPVDEIFTDVFYEAGRRDAS